MEQIEAAGRIAGELEYIMELIPILHKLNYDDLHLYYEDCGIWCVEWANSEYDSAQWCRMEM